MKRTENKSYHSLLLVAAIAFFVLALYSGASMYTRFQNDQLWGYLPLAFLFSAYLSISIFYQLIRKRNSRWKEYLLATAIGLLAGLSFPPLPALPFVLIAWAGIFYLLDQEGSIRQKLASCYHAFIIWNIISTYWVANTAFAAGLIAISVNSLLMCVPIFLFLHLRKNIAPFYHFILFASCWLAFEYFHFRWELHWPWLTLGHYFMNTPILIHWYKIVGVLGGSLWILSASKFTYTAIIDAGIKRRKSLIALGVVFVVPMILSFLLQWTPMKQYDTVAVGVIQPNFEPHYEKDNVSPQIAVNRFLKLSEKIVDSVEVLVLPETFLRVQLNSWKYNNSIKRIKAFIAQHPEVKVVMGLSSFRVLDKDDVDDEYTRYFFSKNGDTTRWENHNSAVFLEDNKPYEIYYKEKFVPGAEYFPLRKIFFFLDPLIKKLGGSSTSMRQQEKRSNFVLGKDNVVAPVICYESIFGEFESEYIEEGATWLAIMTNDGWWDKTAGHKQHLALARFRAIEQERAIARSANSGISAFILPDGSIHKPTKYGEADVIKMKIPLITSRTFYSKYGDVIGRLAYLILLGSLFFVVRKRFVER